MAKSKSRLVLLIGLLLILAVACTPQRKPEQEEQKPTGQEPTISLYVVETEETKEIAMEEYLYGVVAAEMDPKWPQKALAAQAIIARTFTMVKIAEGGVPARGTDASTDIEEFQAYNSERINDNIVKAVDSTRGEVAKHQGNLIKTWFHADAGGKTATAQEGLGYTQSPTPFIQVVDDPGTKITVEENKNWQVSFPIAQVASAVKEVAGQNPGNFTSAEITETGPSGRATKIKFGQTEVSVPALRLALGSTEMRSTFLTDLRVQGGNVVMTGKGFGHGVGMSQWGARALAEDGKSPEEIVQYFFKDVEIVHEYQ